MADFYEVQLPIRNTEKIISPELLRVSYFIVTYHEKSPMPQKIHSHTFMEIFFVTEGRGMFFYHQQFFPIQKGDILIINPNIDHAERTDDKLVYFTLGVKNVKMTNISTSNFIFNVGKEFNEYKFLFNLILQEVSEQKHGYSVISHNSFDILYLKLLRAFKTDSVTETIQPIPSAVENIKQLIDCGSISKNITLDELAAMACMNKYHFVRCFKALTGLPPITYLINIKIEYAKKYLIYTNNKIGFISDLLGFASTVFFTRKFKLATGLTPNEYRKKYKQ